MDHRARLGHVASLQPLVPLAARGSPLLPLPVALQTHFPLTASDGACPVPVQDRRLAYVALLARAHGDLRDGRAHPAALELVQLLRPDARAVGLVWLQVRVAQVRVHHRQKEGSELAEHVDELVPSLGRVQIRRDARVVRRSGCRLRLALDLREARLGPDHLRCGGSGGLLCLLALLSLHVIQRPRPLVRVLGVPLCHVLTQAGHLLAQLRLGRLHAHIVNKLLRIGPPRV